MTNILNDPLKNKGTAFTQVERQKYNIVGQLPTVTQTIEQQAVQVYAQYKIKASDIEKRKFLMQIFDTNRVLFYKVFSQHIVEFMPIVYDPTIAESIENYSENYINPQEAAFLDINHPENIKKSLIQAANGRDIKLAVVTDAEGILGIGDWGVNGVDISVGKLMVYTAAAGINPKNVLPIVIDAGTNNQKLLNDNLYLGNKHERLRGTKYDDFIEKFVTEIENSFPNVYLHWEDFGRSNASRILKKYQNKILTFNDDVQGTGIIVLSGVLGAMKLTQKKLTDQIYVTFGAGSAGAGIAMQVYSEMLKQGLTEAEARKHFYMVDKQGLLFSDDTTLTPAQKLFARDRTEFKNPDKLTNLTTVVKVIKPTILVGTSTQPGTFTEEIVREMTSYVDRPIIFPLSNPTKLAEASAKDLINWSNGRALIATGIPAADVTFNGKTYQIGQGNNALVYPGLGLGAIAAHAKVLSQGMISAAAHALADTLKDNSTAVLPPVSHLDEFSQIVAIAVAQEAINEGIAQNDITDAQLAVSKLKWIPKY